MPHHAVNAPCLSAMMMASVRSLVSTETGTACERYCYTTHRVPLLIDATCCRFVASHVLLRQILGHACAMLENQERDNALRLGTVSPPS